MNNINFLPKQEEKGKGNFISSFFDYINSRIKIIYFENKTQIQEKQVHRNFFASIYFLSFNFSVSYLYIFSVMIPLFVFLKIFVADVPTGLSSAISIFLSPKVILIFTSVFIRKAVDRFDFLKLHRMENLTSGTFVYLYIFYSFVILRTILCYNKQDGFTYIKLRYNTLQKSSSGLLNTYFTLKTGVKESLFLRAIAYSFEFCILKLFIILFVVVSSMLVVGNGKNNVFLLITLLPLKLLLGAIYYLFDQYFELQRDVNSCLEDLSYSSNKKPLDKMISSSLSATSVVLRYGLYFYLNFNVLSGRRLCDSLIESTYGVISEKLNIVDTSKSFEEKLKDLDQSDYERVWDMVNAYKVIDLPRDKESLLRNPEKIEGFEYFVNIFLKKDKYLNNSLISSIKDVSNLVDKDSTNSYLKKQNLKLVTKELISLTDVKNIDGKYLSSLQEIIAQKLCLRKDITTFDTLKETLCAINTPDYFQYLQYLIGDRNSSNHMKLISSELLNCNKDWMSSMTKMLLISDLSYYPLRWWIVRSEIVYIFTLLIILLQPSALYEFMSLSTTMVLIFANTPGALLVGFCVIPFYAVIAMLEVVRTNISYNKVIKQFWISGGFEAEGVKKA